jgi:hypothetical protein
MVADVKNKSSKEGYLLQERKEVLAYRRAKEHIQCITQKGQACGRGYNTASCRKSLEVRFETCYNPRSTQAFPVHRALELFQSSGFEGAT